MTTSIIPQLRAAGVECFTRDEWGSWQESQGRYAARRSTHPMPGGPAHYHFLHITVTADTDTVAEGAAGARQVETYGLSTPPMVSYQDLVTNEGRYFQGQDYGTKGTHTVNDKAISGYPNDLNLYGYAAAIMQNVGDAVTDAQVVTLAKVYAARELAGLVRRGAPILPHRMFAWKSCPGDRAVARIDEIERLRDQYVRDGRLPGTEPKEWDDMATKAELREVVGEVVDTRLAGVKVKVGNRDGEPGAEEWSDDRVARTTLSTLERVEAKLNRALEQQRDLAARLDALEGGA